MKNFTIYMRAIIAIIGFGAAANAQCPGGQAAITVDVTTDAWGYEGYWEITPTGNACGVGTIMAFGNTAVGCAGSGVAAPADPGAYANNTTINENLGCLVVGNCYDIHYVDDYGDGGSTFQVFIDGMAADFFVGAGAGNIFTFCVTLAVPNDATIDGATMYAYTMSPLIQVSTNPLTLEASIANVGTANVTQATINGTVWDGLTALVTGTSTPIATLTPGSSQVEALTPGTYTPLANANLDIEYISSIAEVDGDVTNDTLSYSLNVNDSVMARDNDVVLGLLGIGVVQENARLGQVFSITTNDEITSATGHFGDGIAANVTAGDSTKFFVYEMAGGVPTTLLGSTMGYIFSAADATNGIRLTMGFNPPVTVTAGNDYLLAVGEYNNNVTLATSTYNVVSNTNFVNWATIPGGTWAPAESFGTAFEVQYILRANLGPYCAPTGSLVTDAACNTYTWAQNGQTYTTSGMYYDTLVGGAGCDSIVTLDLTIDLPQASTDVQSSCSDYVWPADGQTYTTTGLYPITLTSAAGCDSIVTLDLTIGSLDATTSTATFTITANAAGFAYQWIDCGNGNAILPGENGQSYTATANGDYAVILTDGACVDTSACVTIMGIGLDENVLSNGIEISPNPTQGDFTIVISGIVADNMSVVITEANGKVIMTQELTNVSENMELPVDLNGMENGVYFVTITANDLKSVQRVVVTK
ncbi:MAG: T9SS type A sorting domain-containing protein [Crocinitomicaceae bacterium]|nr:T9SS type A sorting domain-containing protein [Crocinitomicaceae bacterium]